MVIIAIVIGICILLCVIGSFDVPVFRKLPLDPELQVDVSTENSASWSIQQGTNPISGYDVSRKTFPEYDCYVYDVDHGNTLSASIILEEQYIRLHEQLREIAQQIFIVRKMMNVPVSHVIVSLCTSEKDPNTTSTYVSYC